MMVSAALAGCRGVGTGMEGNIYEKMTIFSLITLTFIAVILIPFVSSTLDSKSLARYRELVRNAPPLPLSATELTGSPAYLWGSRRSLQKMLFAEDGIFSESGIVTANGLDPKPHPCGTWKVDENFGVLNLLAGLYTTEIVLLRHLAPEHCLLVGTTSGCEQWFLDPEKGKEDLVTHLAMAVHLDGEKRAFFA